MIDDDDDDDGDDDDDDASPVVVAGPGRTQAFAVYIYIHTEYSRIVRENPRITHKFCFGHILRLTHQDFIWPVHCSLPPWHGWFSHQVQGHGLALSSVTLW